MSVEIKPPRPARWMERQWERVAFIAHMLLPDYLSTSLIIRRYQEMGLACGGDGPPNYIRWLGFPVTPKCAGARNIWVDFYIIPVFAPEIYEKRKDLAYNWAEEVALAAIAEAQKDGVKLTIGWGAYLKLATDHGQKFIDRHPELLNQFSSTHGDAGTTSLVMETVRQSGLKSGYRVAIIGANGAIGEAVARALPMTQPESILLIGKEDRPGEKRNYARLDDLRQRVMLEIPGGQVTEVAIHQDKARACYDHHTDVVIVATSGMNLLPEEIPVGTLGLDMTTPSACQPGPGWQGRLVLTAGCGYLVPWLTPRGFLDSGGRHLVDVGAGGSHVLWGCSGETIARAAFGWTGHLAGPNIPMEAVKWCAIHFKHLGIIPQPPMEFGRLLSFPAVRSFVSDAAEAKRRSRRSTIS